MKQALQLIVGLGNPGREHEKDRHNVGVWFVDKLAEQWSIFLQADSKFRACVSTPHGDCRLMVPTTYMNQSGQAVGAICRYFKIKPESVLVVHDELDLDPGCVRLKTGGGHAGHNGLRDIISHLGSNAFHRLRIGIGHPGDKNRVSDYVLNAPNKHDLQQIDDAIDTALAFTDQILQGELAKVMNAMH